MFDIYAEKNRMIVRRKETVTSGSVNVYPVRFAFSEDWEGLERTAVFRCGDETAAACLDESGKCGIPREVLVKSGRRLEVGVYGVRSGEVVLPTVWANLGTILEGVPVGEAPGPGGDEETGVSDHRFLIGREAENQHPIKAISDLSQELKRIPEPVEPLTNEELEEIFK